MKAGKHVLCEKLMAWNVTQCKEMIRVADETNRLLSIGHQRHYSMLYAQANRSGEVRRAGRRQAHPRPLAPQQCRGQARCQRHDPDPPAQPMLRDGWKPDDAEGRRRAISRTWHGKYGYKSMEELVRWRLYDRTGGGLMAELGSHQLDACSIFLGKKHPLAVSGVGGKFFYRRRPRGRRPRLRHLRVPRRHLPQGTGIKGKAKVSKPKDDIVVVTYSSVSTNTFEKYGECLMGSRHDGGGAGK